MRRSEGAFDHVDLGPRSGEHHLDDIESNRLGPTAIVGQPESSEST